MCEIEVYGIVRENYNKKILLTNCFKLRDDPPLGNHKKGVILDTLPIVKIENRVQKDGTPAITFQKKQKRNSLDFYFNPPKRVKPNSELVISDIKRQVKLNNDGKLVLEEQITYEEQ